MGQSAEVVCSAAMDPRTLRAALLLIALGVPAGAAERLPAGFVYLRDVAPGIVQDMRYAGSDNFTGRPLPGYDAAECVLRREVAQALARVQADLARENLGPKGLRLLSPGARGRRHGALGARRRRDGATKRFYPALEKRSLFALGYIAAHSAHSTGTAVDLTLVQLPPPPAPRLRSARAYGPCTAPAAERAPDNSLDMGTGFDCFDREEPHRERRDHVRAEARARHAARRHARARLPQLFPRMVALQFRRAPGAGLRFSDWAAALVRQQPLPVLGRDFDHPH